MSRYIDVDRVVAKDWWVQYEGNLDDQVESIISQCKDIVRKAPSIDIVFCKECKYASDNKVYGCMVEHFNGLDDVYHRMYADDFCSYGEREGE